MSNFCHEDLTFSIKMSNVSLNFTDVNKKLCHCSKFSYVKVSLLRDDTLDKCLVLIVKEIRATFKEFADKMNSKQPLRCSNMSWCQ